MPKKSPPQPLPTSIPNPIQVSIDAIAFDDVPFEGLNTASIWPQSQATDALRVDFTVKNNGKADASFCVVTGSVLDGDVTVMSSGDNSKNDFFRPDSEFQSIPAGGHVSGKVLMKWDSKWAAAPKVAGDCLLCLNFWEQVGDPQPGDLSFVQPNPDYNPNAPQTDPNTGLPLPRVPKDKAVYFRIVAYGTGSINVSPSPCLAVD